MKEKELERLFKALANKRRIKIIMFLKEKKGKEANVGSIAEHLHLSFKSTSRHLGVLNGADVLEKDQRSSEVFYRMNRDLSETLTHILKIL